MHRLLSVDGRGFLASIGYRSGMPIMSFDSEESLTEVLDWIADLAEDEAFLAIEFSDSGRLMVMPMRREQAEQLLESQPVDDSLSSIGSFAENVMSGENSEIGLI